MPRVNLLRIISYETEFYLSYILCEVYLILTNDKDGFMGNVYPFIISDTLYRGRLIGLSGAVLNRSSTC